MVNRVYVYNSSNKKIGILTNTRWANMYGIFQSAITVDSGNGKQEAMNELKGISKNASLTSTGDYRCVSGLGVIIEDSRTGLKGRFWIESDSHEWKNGSYTMKLDLEFKNIMDTQEEDEEQTSSSLSDLSESSALEDVLNQARSWIGIGENPPGSNHNEITVLYGMDAAWCCMFIWACFNKSGHADIRYIIHDERDSDTDSYINRYINCHFKFDNSDNDTPGRTAQCIGGGLGIDGYIDINGGVFESIDTTKTGHICVVSYHNSAGANAKNHISIKNTYLKALGYFRINSYGESTEITECEITNCSMGRSVLIGHETGGSNMNINVTQWNNEIR